MPKTYRDRKGRVLHVCRCRAGWTTGWVRKGITHYTRHTELVAPTRGTAQQKLDEFAARTGCKLIDDARRMLEMLKPLEETSDGR